MKELSRGTIPETLNSGRSIRARFGESSFLRIDRELPFLCVYCQPDRIDEGTRALVTNEASYLQVGRADSATDLVGEVVSALEPSFGAFLVLKVKAYEGVAFQIKSGKDTQLQQLGVRLAEFLRQVCPDLVEILDTKPGLKVPPEALCLELHVPTFYQSDEGVAYPLVLRNFRRRFTRATRKLFHHFILNFTPLKPASFHTLGPRAIVKSVWEVDAALEEVSRSFSFLLQVTPTNIEQSWRAFKRDHYKVEPEFVYRPFPVEPTLLKRALFNIPIEKVEDASLHHIFQEKQRQIELKIAMAERRRTRDFLHGSLSLYGGVSPELRQQAEELLDFLPHYCPEVETGHLTAEEFARMAQDEIAYYQKQYDGFQPRVIVRDDLESAVLCDRGNLLIGARASVAKVRAAPLIHHEIGTHLVTYYNGKAQKLKQLSLGLADFLELQEGLAVLSEFLSGPLSRQRMQMLALRVVAVDMMISGAGFVETFAELRSRCKISLRTIYELVVRVYRGGGFTKDAVYLRGLVALLRELGRGMELEPLFVGKIARHHVPLVKELQHRRILEPAPLKPRILSLPEAKERLAVIQQGVSITDLCRFA